MAAEHHEILAAAAVILLAPGAQLEHLSDPPVLDEVANDGIGRRVAIDVGEPELRPGRAAGRDHRIGLGPGAHEGLLHEHALRAGLHRGDRHLGMAIDVPHADGHEIGLHLGEHRPPVAEARRRIEPMAGDRLAEPFGRLVGDRHELDAGRRRHELVDGMPPVAAPRPPDRHRLD
jgi:hypothetical protein